MNSLTNIPFDEIKIGATASVTRRLSKTEVEVLALVGGDVDAFQIAEGTPLPPGTVRTEAVGAEALLSGLINRKLPGPGTTITAQDLRFEGTVQTGDELIATVTARQKQPKGLVVFDCRVKSDGRELVTGTITVKAPEKRLQYNDLATPQVILRRTD